MEEIQRLQNNLLLIRRTVGWTAEEFGEKIGVTRQTINNIESGRSRLTKTQYIAMRSVLDAEMARCPDETEMLGMILDVFIDHPENYKAEDRKALLDKANLITPAILTGTATRRAVSKEWMKAACILGPLGIIGSSIASTWLVEVLATSGKRRPK